MALLDCHFFAESLGMSMSMKVILPEETSVQGEGEGKTAEGRIRTLYLLHGLSDDDSIWCRRTSIERYVAGLGLAVVMPNVHRSFYSDMKDGYRYWSFLSEELPRKVKTLFHLSDRREDNFVAGLSMGGYGAFKLALNHPDRFAAAASLSGCLDLASRFRDPDASGSGDLRLAFGNASGFAGSNGDLFPLAESLVKSGTAIPRLFQCCGTEDELHDENQRFREHALKLGLGLVYEEGPGGHSRAYWDKMIQRALSFML
ncbi:MAG: esterase family protein, partial [Planctomycetes bacterium]|nr:esterase family protein [Planctomycetota bacterium]